MADQANDSHELRAAALLMRHHSQLYGFLYACLGDHADVEDVLQEVSLVAARKFAQLDDERGFLPWVREIARREVLDFQKRKARRPAVFDPGTVTLLADALQRLQARTDWDARHEALTECLDDLPAKSREAIQMRYDDGAGGVDAIAEHLGRTVSATYSVLKRIREVLRECVERKLAKEIG